MYYNTTQTNLDSVLQFTKNGEILLKKKRAKTLIFIMQTAVKIPEYTMTSRCELDCLRIF